MPEHIKQKRCKVCKEHYTPHRTTQQVCSATCAYKHAERLRLKKERQERKQAQEHKRKLRKARQDAKSVTVLLDEAQVYVNKYVRLRDVNEPCISCGSYETYMDIWDAGHYKTRGANSFLRFHLWNIHKQCFACNRRKSGAGADYGCNLKKRIGTERFDYIANAPRSRRYTREEAIRFKRVFMKMCKRKYLKQSEV